MREYKNCKKFKSNLQFIIGDCGAGKTTYAAKVASQYLKKGYPVYSNIYIEGCRQFVIEDLMTYEFGDGAVVILDEGATYGLASRGDAHKKSNSPKVIEYFTMYRHYKVQEIIIISPSFQDIIPVVRSRVKKIYVVRNSILFSLLLLPINIPLALFQKNLIRVSSIKFITKKIEVVGDGKNGSGSEPREIYKWVPITRKFFIQNLYYKYFDSYSRKELPSKIWHVWGEENRSKEEIEERKQLISSFTHSLKNREQLLRNNSQ